MDSGPALTSISPQYHEPLLSLVYPRVWSYWIIPQYTEVTVDTEKEELRPDTGITMVSQSTLE